VAGATQGRAGAAGKPCARGWALLFRLQPDCVQVVDLINRRDLEKRIKTL